MPEESWHGNRSDNQSSVTINNLGKTSIIVLAVVAGLALGISVHASWVASIAERESRLLEQQVMDQNALLVREGLRQPTDHSNGPAGNLQYQRKEK